MNRPENVTQAVAVWMEMIAADSKDPDSLEARWESAVLVRQLAKIEGVDIESLITNPVMLERLTIDTMNHAEFAAD